MVNHRHQANHLATESSKRLKITLVIVLAVMAAEIIGGILSGSLALLGDAGHMLVDALALGMSLLAIRIARRPATSTKTYGYHRVEIMAALANGVILVLVSIYIFYEAYQRFLNPPTVNSQLMLLIAAIGLAANLIGIRLLKGVSHHSLNVKAAYWHVFGDTISSVGVITAAIIIWNTGLSIVDPIIAICIGGIILWGAVRVVREATDILLEAVPKHIQIDKVIEAIKNTPDVEDTHDVHIWTITSNIHALSAHLVIKDQSVSRSTEIVEAVNASLAKNFDITHTTLQLECENCPTGLVCHLNPRERDTSGEGQAKT
jgi:cobalt-zinc-cadmium efflux system protein